MIDASFKLLCDVVFFIFSVNVNFKAAFIVAPIKSVTEKCYDVAANIWRNVADTNFFMARMRSGIMNHWLNVIVKVVKAANFFEHLFTTDVDIVQAEKEVAVVFAFNLFDVTTRGRIHWNVCIHLRAKFVMFQRIWRVTSITIGVT